MFHLTPSFKYYDFTLTYNTDIINSCWDYYPNIYGIGWISYYLFGKML